MFHTLRKSRKHLRKFATKHGQRISAIMMASKLLSVIVFFAVVPMGTVSLPQRENYKSEITLNANSPQAIVGKNRQLEITTGDAQIDLVSKSQAPRVTSNISYESIEREPSYFRSLYQKAGSSYGVPWQLLEAVHYVETGCSDSTGEASSAGATGPMQFMPGTWRTWGVDGDGDGSANITDVEDAVYGAANLLAAGGASYGDYQSALFNYNHAQWYVDKVLNIAYDAGMNR